MPSNQKAKIPGILFETSPISPSEEIELCDKSVGNKIDTFIDSRKYTSLENTNNASNYLNKEGEMFGDVSESLDKARLVPSNFIAKIPWIPFESSPVSPSTKKESREKSVENKIDTFIDSREYTSLENTNNASNYLNKEGEMFGDVSESLDKARLVPSNFIAKIPWIPFESSPVSPSTKKESREKSVENKIDTFIDSREYKSLENTNNPSNYLNKEGEMFGDVSEPLDKARLVPSNQNAEIPGIPFDTSPVSPSEEIHL